MFGREKKMKQSSPEQFFMTCLGITFAFLEKRNFDRIKAVNLLFSKAEKTLQLRINSCNNCISSKNKENAAK